MAIGYTWDVSTVDTYPTLDSNADVVYNVHWRLTAEDDATREAVERVLQLVQPLAYFLPSNTSGQLHVVVDGSQFDAASLEDQLQAVGTDTVNGYDFSGATVTLGTSIVIS